MKKMLLAASLLSFASLSLHANERKFTDGYEARETAAGTVELEQWVTWKTNKRNKDSKFDRLDLRTEVEYSITDKWRMALYYDSRYQDGRTVENDGLEFKDLALESIYVLQNATQEDLGIALYGEAKSDFGDDGFDGDFSALEFKLLLTKDIGDWTLNWNGIYEYEREGDGGEEEVDVLGQALGASYSFSPKFSLGLEALHEVEWEHHWEERGENVVYLGPVAQFKFGGGTWMALSVKNEITDVEGKAEWMSRMIFGISF